MDWRDMAAVCAVLLLGIAYLLNGIKQALERIEKNLGDRDDAEKLLTLLCGDPRMERQIEETLNVGATLTEKQMAYQPGILVAISGKLDRVADALSALKRA